MKVMVIVKASPESEAGQMPSAELLTAMGAFNEELVKAGVMLAGEGLHPSSKGVRVRFAGQERAVINGPFAETKELIAGYWIWQVKSLEEAIAWLKKCPNPMESESDVEIRPIFTAEDFGAAYTPEVREQEDRMRAEIERYQLDPPRIEQLAEKVIAGLNATYTFETRTGIPAHWNRFVPHLGQIPGQVGADCYGVCWNFKDGVGFDYLTGVEVKDTKNLPAGFSEVRLAAGRYAVFTHTKHASAIPETVHAIWSKWLPNSGYEAKPTPSFERYTPEFNPHTGMGGTEIWLALKG